MKTVFVGLLFPSLFPILWLGMSKRSRSFPLLYIVLVYCQDLHPFTSDISFSAHSVPFLPRLASATNLSTALVWELTWVWTCTFSPSQNNPETLLWLHVGIPGRYRRFVKEVPILHSNRCNWVPLPWTQRSSARSNTHIRGLECIF